MIRTNSHKIQLKIDSVLIALLCLLSIDPSVVSAAETPTIKVRITGLFSPEREVDFRAIVKEWPDIKLAGIDFDHAEAEFRFDSAKVFPKADAVQVIARLDDKLRQASNHTFGIKPLSTTPHDKLKRIEIPVLGLDCKACCLAAYEIVAKIDGVEQATASFKEGRMTALIDPRKTDKVKLEEALKGRGITLKKP